MNAGHNSFTNLCSKARVVSGSTGTVMSAVPLSCRIGIVIVASSSSLSPPAAAEMGITASTRESGGMSSTPAAIQKVVKPPKEWPDTPMRQGRMRS